MKASTTLNKIRRRPGVKLWAALAWLALWMLISTLLGEDKRSILLASPLQVAQRLLVLVRTPDFWRRVLFSSLRIMAGMTAGAAAGLLLGTAAFFIGFLKDLLKPLIAVIRSIPVVSFALITLYWLNEIWFSTFISFLICFPVFYSNVLAGLATADEKLLEMADVFEMSFAARLKGIYLPALLPHLYAALEVSVGLAWKSGTAAEYIAMPAASIGERLYRAKINLLSADTLAWTVTIVALNAAFSWLIKALVKKAAQRWGDAK